MKISALVPKAVLASALAASIAFGATVQPARADGAASTRNILLGVAALAGVAIEANVAHKNTVASQVRGYLPNGDVVYGDDRVVARDGDVSYPDSNGQQLSCDNGSCIVVDASGAYANGSHRRRLLNR